MDALIGLAGLAGIIYSIIAMISAKRRHMPIKKPVIILFLGLVLFISGLSMTPQKDNNGIGTGDSTISPSPSAISTSAPEVTPTITPSPDIATITPTPTPTPTPVTLKELKVSFIDVGQADSILIQAPTGESMLIDAGNNDDSNLVVSYLKKQGIEKLDVVIGTHPHEDHIGGLDAVINAFDIGQIYMPKVSHTTITYEDVLTAIKNKGLKAKAPSPGTTFYIGDAKCTVLAPNSSSYEDLNNYSIVIKLEYRNTSFLFAGDAEDVSEKEMLNKKYNLDADVLKVGHHGSTSSTTAEFLSSVSPKYAVIMVGKDNNYGHPHKEVMDRLKSKKIPVYRTDESGTIVCTTDGKTITFNVSAGSYTSGEKTEQSTPTPKSSSGASGDRIVYYVKNGKSYNYSKNCSTLSRSKNILEGKLSDVIKMGKDDPCDVCVR